MKKLSAFASAILSLLILVPNVFAVSEAAVLFLLITPNSRAGGMGEAFVALADDASAVYWNPAGLAFQEGKQFTGMYAKWLPQFNLDDLYYVFSGYRQSVEGLGTVGANITFINLGEQTITGDDLAVLFVQPRRDSDTAAVIVIAGTGPTGMRLACKQSLFVPFIRYPDCVVLSTRGLEAGSATVELAGYFGLDWSVENGEFL
ncbi:UPF0164 family protein, partial [candidate division KSB1 bacterium]|nr:UPF0164 family protein [candidate division KSB1 bacterium]